MSYITIVERTFYYLKKKIRCQIPVLFISVAQCFHVALRVHLSVYVCVENNAASVIIMRFRGKRKSFHGPVERGFI